jgi:hypothetical protein
MPIKAARKHEAGQVLPLLALALVALLGFAALALDGGNLYTEQRRAQAAADNAVMAAAFEQMNGVSSNNALRAAAFANAAQNGYEPGPRTTLAFYLPPIHGQYAGNPEYLEVVITQTVPTALAHLVFPQNPIPLTVIAVAHGSPTGPIMPGYALAAMKPDCDNSNSTIYMQGRGGGSTGGTFLVDGGAFVNAACPNALEMSGSHESLQTDGPTTPINIAGDSYDGSVCTAPGVPTNCNYYPAPTTGIPQVTQDPLANTPAATPPTCGLARNLATELGDGDGTIIRPGAYTTLDSGHSSMTLSPGIYCLSQGKLSSGNGNTSGNGVLIYLADVTAEIDFSGNGSVDLRAPTKTSTGCEGTGDPSQEICKYLGILVYKVVGANTCGQSDVEIDFTGSSTMNVVGLVYAPLSLVRYGGNGSLTMTGQTIAGCVKFNGNGRIDIVYDPSLTYSPPPSVRLDQ